MRYCYSCECGVDLEKVTMLAEFSPTAVCPECGGTMGINPAAQHCKTPTPGGWPLESDAAGVHPDQAREYSDYLRAQGVPTEVLPNGNPVFTSQRHRARVCRAVGLYDRNASYGDAAPTHNMRKRKARVN